MQHSTGRITGSDIMQHWHGSYRPRRDNTRCTVGEKNWTFSEVYNSRIWWCTERWFIHLTVQYTIWSKTGVWILSQLNILCTSAVKLYYAKIRVRGCEITQRLGLLRRSRSFKITGIGTNRKLICDFLLVINTNVPPILHRFRDIAFDGFKIAIFGYPSCV